MAKRYDIRNRSELPFSWITITVGVLSSLLAIFMFNVPDPKWEKIGAFYSFLSLLSLILIALAMIMGSGKLTEVGHPIGVIIGFLLGLGILTVLKVHAPIYTVATAEDVVKTFLVASSEELMFRLALPLFLIGIFPKEKGRVTDKSLIGALVVSNIFFGWFHIIAYGLHGELVFIAFISGMIQSIALVFGSRIFGSTVFLGIIGGHFAWNLSLVSNDWMIITIAYLVIVFGLLLFFRSTNSDA